MRDWHAFNAAGFIAISKQEVRRDTGNKSLASYGEMLLHDFVSQFRDGALGNDAAPIQDREIVGQLPAEFQILLHQKDRHGLLSQKLNGLANLVDDVGLESLGWFVED